MPVPGRRALLAGGAAALALAACGRDEPRRTAPDDRLRTIRYAADHPDQHAVLGLPDGPVKALVALLHGGFWSDAYGADLMDPVAADLRRRGYATWNVEYRRLGGDGGFPATFEDVAAALDLVPDLGFGTLPVAVVGHSAGGQLAAWAAARTADTPGGAPRVSAQLTVTLSGVLLLAAAAADRVGGDAVTELMGSGAGAADYDLADPVGLVPTRGRLVAVHASDDVVVPLRQSRDFVDVDVAAGADAELVTVAGDHFSLIDPASGAWRRCVTELARVVGPGGRPGR